MVVHPTRACGPRLLGAIRESGRPSRQPTSVGARGRDMKIALIILAAILVVCVAM
jgi:hypothetical protein